MSGTRRSIWALIGKVLWLVVRFVLTVLAKLGSRWARKTIDTHAHREKREHGPLRRLRTRRR